ncbi:MAG TPA: KilA-N domain-containing protein [Bacilli bacterium]|nr:KilA-N domain-containing protein [Bacilli bacterium]
MKQNSVKTEIDVIDNKVGIMRVNEVDYISLTDLAKYSNPEDPSGVIRNWMSNKNSFDYYGLWEQINNENFNSVEFHIIKTEEAPYNRFTMTPKRWKDKFNAIGIIPSSGKYSIGTYAHPDIAFEFASWLSPEFKLYLIKEFERLKKNEAYQEKIEWHANRILSKVNYVVHTDAIKNFIVPTLTEEQKKFVYSEEADVLNVALFGITAKEWRTNNPELAKNGNIRDYTDLLHLVILNNLENTNAELIRMNIKQSDRLVKLNESARLQMKSLKNNKNIKELEVLQKQVNDKLLIENK